MNAIILLLAASTAGVDVGWQPLAGGGFEYIIQIEPEALESLKAGNDIISEIPPELVGVKRYRITVGTGPVPRIGTPPEIASGQFQPSAAGRVEAAHDPFASQGVSNLSRNGQESGSTGDRYANSAIDPFANRQTGDIAGSAAAGATPATDKDNSLINRVQDRLYGDSTAEPSSATSQSTAETDNSEQPGSDAGSGTAIGGTAGVPEMGSNPFRQDRYANNPRYTDQSTRFSGGAAGTTAERTDGQTPNRSSFPDSADYGDLPPGEYLIPLAASGASGIESSAGNTTRDIYGSSGIGDRYADRYANRNVDQPPAADPTVSGQSSSDVNSGQDADNKQENNGQGDGSSQPGGLKLSDVNSSSDLLQRYRSDRGTVDSTENETPPPTISPDNATRLANYRSDEAGPNGKSQDQEAVSNTPAEQGQPGWMWTIVVLAMFASVGANAWLAVLLRDSRHKYSQLLNRYQNGEEAEYEEEYEEV
ncbi:MAG: hypothetical protein MPJ50_03500 [Pirellulales bacterium]|nr:hypothetical protein [Pirellulales bacterium]